MPERVVDCGVAEANMISVAAGMSTLGLIPFTHSFTCFATRRCYDQITLSVAYAKRNVKMVGSDPGVTATLNGGTHMSFEDMGIMRNIPGMTIVEPIDGVQLAALFPQIVEHDGPVYIRLVRKAYDSIYADGTKFELGKATTVKEGSDVTIFASGIMVSEAVKAAKSLEEKGINAEIINIHTVKPIDAEAIITSAKKTKTVVTAENHNIINGLGSAVSEVLSENYPVPIKRVGVKDHFGEVGQQAFLMEKYGLLSTDIEKAVMEAIAMKEGK